MGLRPGAIHTGLVSALENAHARRVSCDRSMPDRTAARHEATRQTNPPPAQLAVVCERVWHGWRWRPRGRSGSVRRTHRLQSSPSAGAALTAGIGSSPAPALLPAPPPPADVDASDLHTSPLSVPSSPACMHVPLSAVPSGHWALPICMRTTLAYVSTLCACSKSVIKSARDGSCKGMWRPDADPDCKRTDKPPSHSRGQSALSAPAPRSHAPPGDLLPSPPPGSRRLRPR